MVDDNQDSTATWAELLRIEGHDVHTAHDGLEAVEAAATFQPDIIFLDLGLPGLNGYEAARRIRAQPKGKALVLVALTGWDHEEARRMSAAAGFDRHLVKPVKMADLLQHIADAPC
jgi:CheY-like chemotaxis protein